MVIEKFCVMVFVVWRVRYASCTASSVGSSPLWSCGTRFSWRVHKRTETRI